MENFVKGDVAPATDSHTCPHCGSDQIKFNRHNRASVQYRCKSCGKYHSK